MGHDTSPLQIVLASPPNNSSASLYLRPRIDCSKLELVELNIWRPADWKDNRLSQPSHLIINRYVTPALFKWMLRNRDLISKISYFLDDDLKAMVADRTLPAKSKVRPAQTLLMLRQLRRSLEAVPSQVYVSSEVLARRCKLPDPVVLNPVADLPVWKDETFLHKNQSHICYLAKMHLPEHEFLREVIASLHARGAEFHFTVVASGQAAKLWRGIPNVTALQEMSHLQFGELLQSLDAAISLAPLTPSAINESRSSAKRVEIARLGAAGIFSTGPTYERMPATGELFLPLDSRVWADEIEKLVSKADNALVQARKTHAVVQRDFLTRKMIV